MLKNESFVLLPGGKLIVSQFYFFKSSIALKILSLLSPNNLLFLVLTRLKKITNEVNKPISDTRRAINNRVSII